MNATRSASLLSMFQALNPICPQASYFDVRSRSQLTPPRAAIRWNSVMPTLQPVAGFRSWLRVRTVP